MTLMFPREPVVEMFLGNDWQDVGGDVRQSPPVVIVQGKKDEASKPSPAKCTFTLDDGPDHGDGDYNPTNPMGQWFGYLNRNTPIRVCLPYGEDDFARVAATGWGTSPDMGDWFSEGVSETESSVSSGKGHHSVSAAAQFRITHLDEISIKNVDVVVDVSGLPANVTGAAIEPANICLRAVNTGQYYMLRVTISASEVISVAVHTTSGALSDTFTVPTTNTGQTLRVRFQADANTFRGKVWPAADAEPVDWHVEYSHGDVWGAGWVSIRSGVASGNTNAKPVLFDYDNLEVRIPRFAGEVVKMVPLSELNHRNRRTQVECAGIMRRYQLGQRTLDTAIQRFLTTDPPWAVSAYWPLDGEQGSDDRDKSLLAGGDVASFARSSSTTGAIKWGVSTKRLSLENAVEISYGGILSLPITSDDFLLTLAAAFTWTQLRGADSEVAAYIFLDNGAIFFFEFHVGYTVDVSYFDPPHLGGGMHTLFGIFGEEGDDDQWSNIGFSWAASGGNTDFLFSFNSPGGTTTYTDTEAFNIAGNPTSIVFVPFDSSSTNKITIAHVAVYPITLFDGSPTLIDLVEDAMDGHAGETSGERFVRLCTEEGVSHGMIGYDVWTPPMGGQSRKTFWQLILEAHEVTQGTLFEALGSSGIVVRTNRSMQNQDAALTLDYSNEEVAFPFSAIPDDQGLLNDVTAKRPLGAEFRQEQISGPLNVSDPGTDPNAAGRYDAGPTVNVQTDTELGDAAGWRVHLGTATDPRFPTLTVNLAAEAIVAGGKAIQALDTGIGDVVAVTDMQDAFIFDDLRLIAQGYTEIFDTAYRHDIIFNTTPASPWDAVELDDTTFGLIDSGTTTLSEDLTTTETDVTVAVSDSADLWDDTDQPFDIIIGGERMTVTAISGATSPQTFTVVDQLMEW